MSQPKHEYDFFCGNDLRRVSLTIKDSGIHAVRIQAEFARHIDLSEGTFNAEEIVIANCTQLTRFFWPEQASLIKHLKISYASHLSRLDLSALSGLEELVIYNCEMLSDLTNLPNSIKTIHVHGSKIRELSLAKLKKIETVNIATLSADFILNAEKSPTLKYVSVTSDNSKIVCELDNCAQLSIINVDSKHKSSIVNSVNCPSLSVVNISLGTHKRPSKEQKDLFDKHFDSFKKSAQELTASIHDVETIIQKLGAKKQDRQLCLIAINLLGTSHQLAELSNDELLPAQEAEYQKESTPVLESRQLVNENKNRQLLNLRLNKPNIHYMTLRAPNNLWPFISPLQFATPYNGEDSVTAWLENVDNRNPNILIVENNRAIANSIIHNKNINLSPNDKVVEILPIIHQNHSESNLLFGSTIKPIILEYTDFELMAQIFKPVLVQYALPTNEMNNVFERLVEVYQIYQSYRPRNKTALNDMEDIAKELDLRGSLDARNDGFGNRGVINANSTDDELKPRGNVEANNDNSDESLLPHSLIGTHVTSLPLVEAVDISRKYSDSNELKSKGLLDAEVKMHGSSHDGELAPKGNIDANNNVLVDHGVVKASVTNKENCNESLPHHSFMDASFNVLPQAGTVNASKIVVIPEKEFAMNDSINKAANEVATRLNLLLANLNSICANQLTPNIPGHNKQSEFVAEINSAFREDKILKPSTNIELIGELEKLRSEYDSLIMPLRVSHDRHKTDVSDSSLSQLSPTFAKTGKMGKMNIRLFILDSLIHDLKSGSIVTNEVVINKVKDLMKDENLKPMMLKLKDAIIHDLTTPPRQRFSKSNKHE